MSEIDNLFYASGGTTGICDKEEQFEFDFMVDALDEKTAMYKSMKQQPVFEETRFHKRARKGITDGTWYNVDTEGKFWVGNNHYQISHQAVQYEPVSTEYGDYYAMDRILLANGQFYDMNYDEVEVHAIGGIVPRNTFWTEN